MRRTWLLALILGGIGCGGASKPGSSTELVLPAGSAHLRFDDLFPGLCDALSCPGATRVIVAGATDVAISRSGSTSTVGLTLIYWWLKRDCSDPNGGCNETWIKKRTPACYSVAGATVTPSTGCPKATSPGAMPAWAKGDEDLLSQSHSVARAFFGVDNGTAVFTAGAARGTWGDLSASIASVSEFWGLQAQGPQTLPMLAVFSAADAGSTLAYLLPAPDGQPVVPRTSSNADDPAQTVYWADRSDTVYALDPTATQLKGRRVRKALSEPVTQTVGTLEASDGVVTLVLSPSTTTISGSTEGPRDVYEVSLVTSSTLGESEAPLAPFLPFWAHTPDSASLVVCFSEPLDSAALSVDQFSSDGALTFTSVSNTVVPQCARLVTSPQSREKRYHVTVSNVTSRSGAVVQGAVISATPDDTASGAGVTRLSDLSSGSTVPLSRSAFLPVAGGSVLAANAGVFGLIDAQGVTFQHLETGSVPPPLVGLANLSVSDPGAAGIWANWSTSATTGVLAFYEPDGQATRWTTADLPGVLLTNSGYLQPVGDGSVLLYPKSGSSLLRLRKGGAAESVPLLSPGNYRGPERVSHDVLFEDQGRLKRLQLPSTVATATFSMPSSALGGLATGSACETQGVLYWCGYTQLFRLGDTSSPALGACTDLTADGTGGCWAHGSDGLRRARGLTVTPVTLANPLDPATSLTHPEFFGDTVFTNDRTLRMSAATWASLAGSVP